MISLSNSDIERILGRISSNKFSPRDIVNLGVSLAEIPLFKKNINKNNKELTK